MGRHKEALKAYRDALAIDPSMPEALNETALCLRALGRLDEAFEAFLTAVERHPEDSYARLNLAE